MKNIKDTMGMPKEDGDIKKKAKLEVLMHLKKIASDMMGEDVRGGMASLKKLSGMAPPKESEKAGIDTMRDVVGYQPTEDSTMEPDDVEDTHTADDLDAEITRLQALKAKKTPR